jgi:glycosyltransferase involved in cell wall biosynthesis
MMTILSVAFPLLTVSADAAGGSEQILWQVERGLVNAGHRPIVVAAEGSSVSGTLVPTMCANGEINDAVRSAAHKAHRRAIRSVLESSAVDLIHFHGLDFPEYLPVSGPPMLATLHLPLDWYPERIFHTAGLTLNFVSHSQAASNRSDVRCPVILNGIDLSRYDHTTTKEDFALVLSRVCPEKGIDVALRVARRLGMRLLIAGPVHPFATHQAYFKEEVEPLLDDRRQYIGPVGLVRKSELLARARCLLVPSSVAETSSLVAMEAIASGTPVVAFRSGALPEVVEHGQTGFIVDSEDAMSEAVMRAGEISPERCRASAASRFDSRRMVRDYLELYGTLCSSTMRQRRMASAPQSVL